MLTTLLNEVQQEADARSFEVLQRLLDRKRLSNYVWEMVKRPECKFMAKKSECRFEALLVEFDSIIAKLHCRFDHILRQSSVLQLLSLVRCHRDKENLRLLREELNDLRFIVDYPNGWQMFSGAINLISRLEQVNCHCSKCIVYGPDDPEVEFFARNGR